MYPQISNVNASFTSPSRAQEVACRSVSEPKTILQICVVVNARNIIVCDPADEGKSVRYFIRTVNRIPD